MPIVVEVDPGLDLLAAALDAAAVRVEQATPLVVAKTAHMIEGNARQIAPVDTGALRNSIHTDIGDAGLSATIGAGVFYAVYVELGTSRMAPHAFLGPSLDRYGGTFVAALGQLAGDLR